MKHATLTSLLGACTLLLAFACSDDENVIDNTPGGSGSGGEGGGDGGDGGTAGMGSGAEGCPEHPAITTRGDICEINSSLDEPITEDLTLDPDHTWLMVGPVIVGDDADETVLTVEPGTTVFGNEDSFILIQRGSKIMADGTADAPIVFTSSNEVGERRIQDWGGLVINGRAPINVADGNDEDPGSAPGEADTGRFGGEDANDDSGVLRYVRIEFAGKDVDPENELNGIAFQGVGSGTTVDYVQIHMAFDDAVEFFGGTVGVKHLVLTGINDDKIDWTDGWRGKAQFVVSQELDDSGQQSDDPRGIEADNEEMNNEAAPISSPILSNITLIARDGNDQDGIRLRRGTQGRIWNSIVVGYGPCLHVTEPATEANVTSGDLAVRNLVLNCASVTDGSDAEAALINDANVLEADAMLDAWMPMEGSPALGIGDGPDDSWFDSVDYAGAFDGENDWTEGWIETATE